MTLRSFDAPRRRSVPTSVSLDNGATFSIEPGTVFVAVKSHCDGCHAFLSAPDVAGWRTVPVATDAEIAAHDHVVASAALLTALDIRSAPFFVAVDGSPLEVVSEGVPFDLAHLAELLPVR